jgi:hypothetical protein
VQLGNYGQALGPWQILARQSPLRPAVQEALLAVPYAYEKLGSLGSALQEFEAAEAVFSSEINRLERLKSSLQPGDLVAAVSIDEARHSNGENLDPELLGLVELLSGERFSLYRNEIRDLHALNERLHYWDENIDIYASMLAQRKLRRAELLEAMQDEDYQSRLQQFALQRDVLAKALAAAETPEGLWKIADEETLALWLRVERAEAALQRINAAGKSTTEERQILDRYRGMVLWQASERMSDWHWQAVKRLSELDRALETARASMQRVSAVVADAPDILPFERRLVALEQRLQLQRVAVERSVVSTEAALQAILVEELGQQQARLRHYQSQARLARARLFDRAQLEMPQ